MNVWNIFPISFLLLYTRHICFGVFPIVTCEQSKFQIARQIDSMYQCKWMQICTISEMLHWTFHMHTIMLSHIKIKTTSTIIVRTSWREEICGPGVCYILKDLNFIALFWLNTTALCIYTLTAKHHHRQLCGITWRPHIPRAWAANSMQISLWTQTAL